MSVCLHWAHDNGLNKDDTAKRSRASVRHHYGLMPRLTQPYRPIIGGTLGGIATSPFSVRAHAIVQWQSGTWVPKTLKLCEENTS